MVLVISSSSPQDSIWVCMFSNVLLQVPVASEFTIQSMCYVSYALVFLPRNWLVSALGLLFFLTDICWGL